MRSRGQFFSSSSRSRRCAVLRRSTDGRSRRKTAWPRRAATAVLLTITGLGAFLATGAAPVSPAGEDPALLGAWSDPIDFQVEAIHASLLPDGRVMYFAFGETPRVWDPETGGFGELATPEFTLFCTGHSALGGGRIFFAGGGDGGDGYPYATIYSVATDTWTQLPDMNAGRWYPTTLTMANGEGLVVSGTINADGEQNAHGGHDGAAHAGAAHAGAPHGAGASDINVLPQVWTGSGWRDLTNAQKVVPEYAAIFLAPNGKAFMAGPGYNSYYLDTEGTGEWIYVAPRILQDWRGYGSAVMYDDGKVLFVGGAADPPTATAEVIDLNAAEPSWRFVGSMETPRRQTNATILADGTVLITGGTSGPGFNDKNSPVYTAERWDPDTEQFTTMAAMQHPRWYHSIALLLPDGRVLSAGGTDWTTAEIYSPPYLFRGPRPSIDTAPETVEHGETFFVGTPDAAEIAAVHLIRNGAVTHATNMDQRISRLGFTPLADGLSVTMPPAELGPPGSYMLFLLNDEGVPSVAAMLHVVAEDGDGAVYTAIDLAVDALPRDSANGNGVLEPEEVVEVTQTWRNDGVEPGLLDGEATDFAGPEGATYTIEQGLAHYGVVNPGTMADCKPGDLCYWLGVSAPGGERPATHWDAGFTEVLSDDSTQDWALHVGKSFDDVPRSSPFYGDIETLLHHGVTHGCGDGSAYCPAGGVSRAAMATLLLRALEGPLYKPPVCEEEAERFADVPFDDPFCPWIEELAARGVVVGCGGDDYCPDAATSRAQMAIVLLRALEGDDYSPPECNGVFVDTPCPSIFTDWVEELFRRQIASGCEVSPRRFCPTETTRRGAVATLLTRAFGLDLYGP